MAASVTVNQQQLTDLDTTAQRLAGAAGSQSLRLVIGRALQQVIKNHFVDLANDSKHHKTARRLGATSTGVYEEAARRTQAPKVEGGGVSVSVNQVAIAQRYFGGKITPKNAKWLTIPADRETYGKRAGEFANLRFVRFRENLAALVSRAATVLRGGKRGARNIAGLGGHAKGDTIGGRDEKGQYQVFFWLVKSATQSADPTVLPENQTMLDAAVEAASNEIARLMLMARIGVTAK